MHLAFSQVKKVEKTTQFLLFKNFLLFILLFCFCFSSNAQVIISEVFADGSFELKNTGDQTIDVSSYSICTFPAYNTLSELTVTCGALNLSVGETVVVSGFTGYEGNDGELGLYRTTNFANANAIIAYVEWGSSDHQRSSVARLAGLWQANNAAPSFSDTESLVYDEEGNSASDWSINTNPAICPTEEDNPIMEMATYTITFNSVWSSETHPTDFPSNPHFSGLIGMTHNSDTSFFEENTLATEGIRVMAELGGKGTLTEEIQAIIMGGAGGTLISGGGIGVSPGSITKEFEAVSTHPLLSITSMISPSPDWCVAVTDIPLYENGSWVEELTLEAKVYDAGTDSGRSYDSVNDFTSPQGTIQPLTEGPLVSNGMIPSLGTFTIQRVSAVDTTTTPTDTTTTNPIDTTTNEMPTDSITCTVAGGNINGGPFEFCVGDNIPDNILSLIHI